ncbi:MAG: M6 family metalloprotease domain-containing protein, partial [Candidatus Marinimicrobia bacterium]|nr:M6 family metalloprotease domain-containing protein [Candidatus Neomarinimicrobiota bacterium]
YTNIMQAYRERKNAFKKGMEPDTVSVQVPVLVMQYSDIEPEWPISRMEDQLFELHDQWPTGSMTDYYLENSYGAFEVTGQVYGWIPMTGDAAYYERNPDDSYGPNTYELLTDAIAAIDSAVDFSIFDNDGDGTVETIVYIHSGIGGEYQTNFIWSHSWSLAYLGGSAYTTNDTNDNGFRVSINDYVIQPAVDHVGEMEAIGVFCHEYGHALGLPDLYDRDGSSGGIGDWGLMASGGSESSRPSHLCAWSKEMLGWITPIVVTDNLYAGQIPAVVDTPAVYKLWTKGAIDPYTYIRSGLYVPAGREYFLVENRQRKKFDNHLPGAGLLIWHIQNNITTQNDDEGSKLVDLEEAHGRSDLDQGSDTGSDDDPFPGTTGNHNFSRASFPSSDTQSGGYSKVAVENISESADFMTANLSVFARDLSYVNNIVIDSTGNNNGYADPGETIKLKLELLNLGPAINTLNLTLLNGDQYVSLLDNDVLINGIGEDSTTEAATDAFELAIAPDAPYHPIQFEVVGNTDEGYWMRCEFIVMMENLKILLVDDTGGESDALGQSIISYYHHAFEGAGISYYTDWSTSVAGTPTIPQLGAYRTLLWVTGSADNTLSTEEQLSIGAFLDTGGSLFITGQNIGYDLDSLGTTADSAFYRDYLKASYLADGPDYSENILLTGVAGDSISDDYAYPQYFYISGGDGAGNQQSPDIIAPVDSAITTMEFFGTGLMGLGSGISYAGEDYRLVYYSFGVEGINEIASDLVSRSELIARVIDWLQEIVRVPSKIVAVDEGGGIVPEEFDVGHNYPNPFNARTNLPYIISQPGQIAIDIYDITGRTVFKTLRNHGYAGSYEFTWDGRSNRGNLSASGVYIIQFSNGSQRATHKVLLLK